MRVCYPSLYEWVRSHPDEVLGPYRLSDGGEGPAIAALRAAVETATVGLSADDAARARTLLTTVLPRTESAWDKKQWGSDWDEPWTRDKRIASKLYFRRYFAYSIPPGDAPDADLDDLIAEVDKAEPDISRVVAIASAVLDSGTSGTVIPKLASRVPSLGSRAAAELAMVVTHFSDRLSDESGFLGLSDLERAAVLVRDLLGRVVDDERSDLAATLMRDTQHLPFAVELLRWLRPQDDHQDRAVLTMEDCDAAGRVLADRLLEVWCAGDPFEQLGRKVAAALHVCAIYGDGAAMRQCLRRRTEDDVTFATALMRSFLGQSWSMDTGAPLVPDLRREGYEALREYVDPEWLFPHLQQRFGEEIGAREEGQPRRNADDHERLAEQYARFYRADVSAGNAGEEESM